MAHFKIDHDIVKSELFPSFSLAIYDSYTTAIYSDTDIQAELVQVLKNNGNMTVFDCQEGLYKRLSVESNIKFYRKWFGCQTPLAEILVLFELHTCAKMPLYKCSESEIRRVYYAKYFMSGIYPAVFEEPIHGVDIKTVNTFINMLQKLAEAKIPSLILVSNLEHALLLGDAAYSCRKTGCGKLKSIPAIMVIQPKRRRPQQPQIYSKSRQKWMTK